MEVSLLQHAKDKSPQAVTLDKLVELIRGGHWSATDVNDDYAWNFRNDYWNIQSSKTTSLSVRPVLGF